MKPGFIEPALGLVVYTDLDGTLLDHDSYSFQPALPALKRLQALAVPVIPVTSKTLAELDTLTRQLELNGPCVAENGGLIAYPPDYFAPQETDSTIGRFLVEQLSPSYQTIVAMLNEVRLESGFRFEGFADMSAEKVSRLTGLPKSDAALAKQRLCSEPVVWLDSESAFEAFSATLKKHQYRLVQGGRFWHVMGQADKAFAIRKLNTRFAEAGFSGFKTIALGDSPNDIAMLLAADIAVLVRRKDGSCMTLDSASEVFQTTRPGPQGWNEFFQTYLHSLAAGSDTTATIVEDTHRGTRHG
ncbi:HAD-IIB family hydrolase [Thiogranum longum]